MRGFEAFYGIYGWIKSGIGRFIKKGKRKRNNLDWRRSQTL